MLDRTNVIYLYDGTIEGLYSCIFESFEKKEQPMHILSYEPDQITFTTLRPIGTDMEKAARVAASISKKISPHLADFINLCFLTCHPDKEVLILELIRKGFRIGPRILDCLADDTVDALTKAVQHLTHEAHLFTGFIRFSIYDGILVSIIQPKNIVLPLLLPHFCDRYPQEAFMIYDKTHGMALAYRPYESQIIPIDSFILNAPEEEELQYQNLWRRYYNTIGIEGRYNPKCRMSHMPKRYWDYMTEFQCPGSPHSAPTENPKRLQ